MFAQVKSANEAGNKTERERRRTAAMCNDRGIAEESVESTADKFVENESAQAPIASKFTVKASICSLIQLHHQDMYAAESSSTCP